MLNHFNKLNSPLKTAIRNPSAEDQKKRFTRGNWKDIDFRSLWSLWSDDGFLPRDERQALDQVEPFDEWEEFQLFCSHYFLLIARNIEATKPSCDAIDTANMDQLALSLTSRYRLSRGEPRRFGASSHADTQIWTTGGYGLQSRLDSTELLHPCGDLELTYPPHYVGISTLPVALMCHTTTIVEKGQLLLVGGRSSPSSPSAACYLWHGKTWSQVEALPFGLYRHTAVSVRLPTRSGDTPQHGVLVFGGKTGPSRINDKWLLWTETDGWTMLECSGSPSPPEPRFGAAMARSLGSWMQSSYLTGGIGSRGVILQDLWDVRLCRNDQDRLVVFCQDMTCGISSTAASPSMLLSNLGRFGASLVPYTTSLEEYQQFLLIGGVVRENVLVQGLEVLQLNIMGHDLVDVQRMDVDWSVRPMLIGSSVEFVDEATIVVAYGGAVCFSFGTYWNDGVWTLSGRKTPTAWNVVKKQESATNEASSKSLNVLPLHLLSRSDHDAVVAETQGSTLDLTGSATDFDTIMNAGQPLILSGLHLGPCLQTWTLEHLKQNIGCDRKVVVHAAASPTMNFLAKDFDYATIPFGDFVDKVASGERWYMRAISKDTNTPTSLEEDFPTIAQDFQIPTELAYITANMHSSVLRMSGPVNMWLHFDVQANIYCQIQGEKRLILFPPTDVQYLDFPAGASSSRLNIFDADGHAHYPAHTQPINFDISPGDVLYIPPLWLHSAKPTSGTSIAVNVFFRSLQSGYAAGKDVYGNRDLQAYENGRRDVGKITKAFKGLPEDVRKFYLSRLAGEILEAAV
jgi:tRNA wybutosine-synthesizing protein 4